MAGSGPWTSGGALRGIAGAVFLAFACGEATAPTPAIEGSSACAKPPATEWTISRGDQALTGVTTGRLPRAPELVWTLDVGRAITSSPVVAGGKVYFGADDYELHCADAASGEELWTYRTEDMIEAPPMVVEGTVFCGSTDFFFYAIDAATGELRWKHETDEKIVGGANYWRGPEGLRVLVGSYDACLYCFDAASGELSWKYETDNYVNGTPAVADGRAVFGGCDAVLHVVLLESGKAASRVELGSGCHVAASVGLADGRAYFGHYGNEFLCVDLDTAEQVWSYSGGKEPFFSSPAIGEDRVVFGGRDRNLHCVRRADGEGIWEFATRRKVDSSPVIVGDEVVFGSADGRLYILALADGRERWSHDLGAPIVCSPAVAGGRIYLGSTDGVLYAFGEADRGNSGR